MGKLYKGENSAFSEELDFDESDNLLLGLDESQLHAVTVEAEPIAILAGAGSGKTGIKLLQELFILLLTLNSGSIGKIEA